MSQEGLTLCARKALRCIWPRQEAAIRVAALSRRCWRAVRRPTWPRHAAAMRVAALRASRSILLACKPLPAQAHESDKGHRSTEPQQPCCIIKNALLTGRIYQAVQC